ncbi:MAG: hypothetical protein A2X86_20905 [Bdellovibrionales bacterium GWA2_49_15]|nr:MAG: hypothetical protein A2X86_20905 [Bdellovibrionales bacterium GWA2_49_15]HAZ14838.1 hypothetical protein [Bdellovibrionales bacterium]
MKLTVYKLIYVTISFFLAYEYAVLNGFFLSESFIAKALIIFAPQNKINLSPAPGYPLSFLLGCLGFSLLLLMNVYSLRKRSGLFKRFGPLSAWLEFHIFCGILGTILIIFHCNFKVHGLVSISFWSMIISSTSGIFGKYVYVQTLQKKEEIKNYISTLKDEFIQRHATKFTPDDFVLIFQHAFKAAGVSDNVNNPFIAFFSSVKAEAMLLFTNPAKRFGLDKKEGEFLKILGRENRRAVLLEPFKLLLGYWHSFHFPFAIFMYLVAFIHIAVALLFRVTH